MAEPSDKAGRSNDQWYDDNVPVTVVGSYGDGIILSTRRQLAGDTR